MAQHLAPEKENASVSTGNSYISSEDPKSAALKRLSFSSRNPFLIAFIVIFVALGVYLIVTSSADSIATTKVWSTAADWSGGTLSNATVIGNGVSLAQVSTPLSTGSSGSSSGIDLSLNHPARASSVESKNSLLSAKYVDDGSLSTRWSSNFSDPQWIYEDLKSTYKINEVKLYWETAYAKSFEIQTSTNARQWTTIYTNNNGTGRINDITGLNASARYVRMYGLKRATQWGYSLYEMGVYGSQSGANTTKPATTYDSKGSITLSFDAGRTANWTSLNGLTTLPSGTSVSYEARTSTDDSTWSTWATVPTSGSLSSLTSNRYIQIEANLSSSVSTATPLLTQLSLGYSIPIASPTVSLSSSSTTLSAGSSTTLTWSSSNATGCTASGGWSGARAISGSAPVSPTATTTYSLSCTGNGGTTSATPITVTVSAPTAPDPSGQPVPVGNQPGWQQVFYDNFENENVSVGQFSNCSTSTFLCSGLPTNVQSKWWDYPDTWPDTSGNCEYYPSQTLSIASNVMNMYIHTASNGTCMTAVPEAKLPNSTDGSNGQLYGMYSVRMKSDPVAGYKTAFLLWPDSENWPQDGEIDFPEGDLDSTVGAHMHYQGATSGGDQDNYSTNTTYTDWHTYTTEWTPTSVEFLIDGQVIGDSTNAANIPDTPMHWVLQTESEIGAAKPASSASGNLQISWVSVWSYDPSTK